MIEKGKYEKSGYESFSRYPDYCKKFKSLMSKSQICFLMGLIKDYTFSDGHKVLNVLEIGVFNGVSSLYMLKEGVKSRGEQFQLYGIDIMPDEGFLAQAVHSDATDEEKSHYRLCAKSTTFDLEKNLGDTKIDMVFIDGNHNHPYVVIDLINIIPFLHKESLVCLHDSFDYKIYNEWGACYIYDVWDGYKYLAQAMNLKLEPTFPNSLSLIKIPENKEMLYRNLLTVIDIPVKPSLWQMSSENRDLLSDESVLRLENFISRYYDTDFARDFCGRLRNNIAEYRRNIYRYLHENEYINNLFTNQNRKIVFVILAKIEKIIAKFRKRKYI